MRTSPLARLAAAPAALLLIASPLAASGDGAPSSVPHYDHVAVVVLENESFGTTFGPGSPATYLNNTLVPQSAFDRQYYGIGHVSLDNYVAMVSGQPDQPLTGSDCATVSLWECAQGQLALAGGRNLADQLEGAGRTWKGYMDSMPSACFHGPYDPTNPQPDPYQGDSQTPPAKDYADRHNPFNYFPDIVGNDARCQAHVVPYTQLASDIAANTVPNFSFITPDTCHDGHDAPCSDGSPGGLVSADAWLSTNIPPLLHYMQTHNGVILLTFDEGAETDLAGCCHGGPGGLPGFGGRIGLLALGHNVAVGVTDMQGDHAALLRTLEDIFGISEHLNNAAASTTMSWLFEPAG